MIHRRGARASEFCQLARRYIDDVFEHNYSISNPYADGTYNGPMTFEGLNRDGHARFARAIFYDAANTRYKEMVHWSLTPTEMFSVVRKELKWGTVLLPALKRKPGMPAIIVQAAGAKLPSAYVLALEALTRVPRKQKILANS